MQFSIMTLAKHSKDGRVYRSFDHVIVATCGMVVAVPITQTVGELHSLAPFCPVPWEEMWAILDTPAEARAAFDLDLFAHIPAVLVDLGIADDEFLAAALPEFSATVFAHPSGLRLGISNDFIHKIED